MSKEQSPEITEDQIKRGESALFPFVEAWHLSLNPEDLELMAFAVIKHALADDTADHEAIVADVKEMIEKDAEEHQRMIKTWQESIDLKSTSEADK